ncbi:aminotransferase class I/II-fold pyridoxal phosphate-dependent enzyme [Sinorhizobium meliloti]|uniref:aminotransferase class I/II-fold pyridoxal phosphate-dependent enzyme n=1 Tax=Rhizobium meliloti TaxID=382 RepID=UPI000FDA0C66|nr:aminotransferase class I/II-fold pyridoxal phosphate-dependent enzyme [Sinorhizobium meliloti]RVI00566.1 aminotransferase class I/II-fold pyridoxal phosphate-dependent enzyme [Sinorhizobium meliloti]
MTPSNQYPVGSVLSLSRRLGLLAYAEENGSWIVEDDYDSEFRYQGHPIASLHGLDKANRVLYTGTFSEALLPSLRVGYLVVPADVVDAFRGRASGGRPLPANLPAARDRRFPRRGLFSCASPPSERTASCLTRYAGDQSHGQKHRELEQ